MSEIIQSTFAGFGTQFLVYIFTLMNGGLEEVKNRE